MRYLSILLLILLATPASARAPYGWIPAPMVVALAPDGTPIYDGDPCHLVNPMYGDQFWSWTSSAPWGWYIADTSDGPDDEGNWPRQVVGFEFPWRTPNNDAFGWTLRATTSAPVYWTVCLPLARSPPYGRHYTTLVNNAPGQAWGGSVFIGVSDYTQQRWDWWQCSNWSRGRLARPIDARIVKLSSPNNDLAYVTVIVTGNSYAVIGDEWTLQTAPD